MSPRWLRRKGPRRLWRFSNSPERVIGPEDDIPHPPEVKNLDYEVELAIVIGKPCVDVSEDEALDYVAGYSAFNDISARDTIRGENKNGIHLMGKSFPGFAPMGPYLVTADEIPDPQNLKLRLSVNGETRQDSNLSYMIFKIRDMIAYWSQMGLNPGDVLTTGTPRGVAAGRKPDQAPWWLKPGDIVEAEVENIGRLRTVSSPNKLSFRHLHETSAFYRIRLIFPIGPIFVLSRSFPRQSVSPKA